MQQAIFAAGRFWGVQHYFDQVPGVQETLAGYIGGDTEEPTYEEVSSHETGHAEAVLVSYDPDVVTFETLMRHFFRLHDPTQLNRQGPDVGDQYRSAVFCTTDVQEEIAEQVKANEQNRFDQPIVTQIIKAGPFYRAEAYHQKYAERTGRGVCPVEYAPLEG